MNEEPVSKPTEPENISSAQPESAQPESAQPQTPKKDPLAGCRSTLISVFAFSLINVVLAAVGASVYFLFSASIPYVLACIGRGTMDEGSPGLGVAVIVVAIVLCLFYLLCWFFSKNGIGGIVAALIFFLLDTAALALLALSNDGGAADMILDAIFHIWVLFSLITGLFAAAKARREAKALARAAAPWGDGRNMQGTDREL